ncbi:MAG: outer membrane beta-barrel protein [Phaeodactylibacter sp.]|nr:outer membrane beta-barrel protein [Phaeodactylibacter sp.]MCB9273575.1 outer membrane beta-barrel protein [Lewinellaceae bacterium]
MKKQLLLFAFFFCAGLAQAQQSWSLGLDYFPNLSETRSIGVVDISEKESPKFCNNIGFSLSRELSPGWMLVTGIGFANIGHRYTDNSLRWGSQHNGNGGFDPTLPAGEDIEGITINYNYDYLEAPLKVQYSPLTGPWRLYLSGGVLFRVFLGQRYIIIKNLGGLGESVVQEKNATDINPLALALHSGIGLERTLAGRYQLFLEPRLQLSYFGGRSYGNDFQEKYLSYGAAAGLRLKLGR